jgi:hypothetical protein
MRRRRALIYATLALAVPLPALALTEGSEAGLSVSASLHRCGVAGGGVVCEIGASFSGVEGAEYYTASVIAPDGTVTDYGQVGGAGAGSASLWVPYVGSGTYTVTVSAWGYNKQGDPKVLETGEADTEEKSGQVKKTNGSPVGEGGEYSPPSGGEEQAPEAGTEPQPVPDEPVCDPAEVPPAPPAPEGTEAPVEGDAAAATTTEAAPSTDATEPPCPPDEHAAPTPTP